MVVKKSVETGWLSGYQAETMKNMIKTVAENGSKMSLPWGAT